MTPNFEFTELEVEAAQNLWEAFNDLYRACYEDRTDDDTGLVSLRNSMGTVHVRWLLRQKPILSAVVRAWDAASEDVQEMFVPYDWNFCPWFLQNCIVVTGDQLSVASDEEIQEMMAAVKE